MLYRHICQKDKVLTSRRVVSFDSDEHGVSVECQDGSVHRGNILVGADGIRSTVGRQISELSGSSKKGNCFSYFPFNPVDGLCVGDCLLPGSIVCSK